MQQDTFVYTPVNKNHEPRSGFRNRELLTWSSVFEHEVLIVKLPAIDGLSACAVVVGEVASLAHELRDDTMEAAALVAKALFMCAQAAEVL